MPSGIFTRFLALIIEQFHNLRFFLQIFALNESEWNEIELKCTTYECDDNVQSFNFRFVFLENIFTYHSRK